MSFRKVIFWLHLIAGVIAGVAVFIMSATGVALAFEKEIIAWAESDSRIAKSTDSTSESLKLDELLQRLREKNSEPPSAITLENDPSLNVLFSFGRTNSYYVNPYSGEVHEPAAKRTRAFMQTMLIWHRYLGGQTDNRELGKAITGACNVAFLFLAVSGIYLWWPRQWTRTTLRAVGLMSFRLSGKARDWNWHNAVGIWCAPILIVLTATAMPISYRWASDAIYKITGSPLPAPGAGPRGPSGPPVEVPPPPAGVKPLELDALVAVAKKEVPNWKQITWRNAGGGRDSRAREGNSERKEKSQTSEKSEAKEKTSERLQTESSEKSKSPQPVALAIVEKNQWPLFASTQLTLDPFTGNVLRKETYADWNLGRQVRSWMRFLHTGEALGKVGKFVAGAASAGAMLLVWTGFALAWRRFFGRKNGAEPAR